MRKGVAHTVAANKRRKRVRFSAPELITIRRGYKPRPALWTFGACPTKFAFTFWKAQLFTFSPRPGKLPIRAGKRWKTRKAWPRRRISRNFAPRDPFVVPFPFFFQRGNPIIGSRHCACVFFCLFLCEICECRTIQCILCSIETVLG